MKVEVVQAKIEHAYALAPRLAEYNREAILGLGYMTVEEALRWSLEHSLDAWTVLVDGDPEVLGGVADVGTSAPPQAWVATTEDAYRARFTMHRVARKVLELYGGQTVQAVVYAIDRPARRWLEALGFKLWELRESIRGEPFYLGRRT